MTRNQDSGSSSLNRRELLATSATLSALPLGPNRPAMLKNRLLHPDILAALGRAGHGSKVLIADGNYPFSTTLGPNAMLVSLNLSPAAKIRPRARSSVWRTWAISTILTCSP